MENKSHALAAGLFAIVLGLAVLASLFWLGGKKEQTSLYTVVTRQNVNGLNPQGQVRYRGIRVGKVRDIQLDPEDVRNILIEIEVDAKVPVTYGTVAKLSYQGVTGLAHILLEDTGKDARLLAASAESRPPRILMGQSLFDELGETGRSVLQQANQFFSRANSLLDDNGRKNIAGTLENLESSTAALNRLLSDEKIQRLGSAVGRVDDAAESTRVFFKETKLMLPKVQSLIERLDTLVGDQSSEGATATVARINDLARDLSLTSRQLNRVLRVVEQSPDSLLFGAPVAQPGPGEPGFVPPVGSKP